MGCRLNNARIWAIRCTHEASLYEENSFHTFTYDDDNLPFGETLVRSDFQNFVKRLREKVPKFRIFYCGEYGSETKRPHYHALIFNYTPSDPVLVKSDGEKSLYTSKIVTDTWGLGKSDYYKSITFTAAAYVAGYVTKKINGDKAEEHYQYIDEETGEIIQQTPEFSGQSMRPGIGQAWIQKFHQDVYLKDEIIINGLPMRPPLYYDLQLQKIDPALWRKVRAARTRKHIRKLQTITEKGKIVKHGYLDADKQTYYGTERQMRVHDKITKSKQKKRTEI